MRYAIARINENNKELSYRIYVTDTLRLITENTAKFSGGSYFKDRFIDRLQPKKQETKKENRNGQEISRDIIGALTAKR